MTQDLALFLAADECLTHCAAPSACLRQLPDTGAFALFAALQNTPQSPKYHPEGNVWNHTLLVVDEAAAVKAQSSDPRVFMWAALLHDVGKPGTTKIRGGKITSYDHDRAGSAIAEKFLSRFALPQSFVDAVCALVRWHMQPLFVQKDMKYADIAAMQKQTAVRDVALLGLCDRLGRGGANRQQELENIRDFLERCGAPPSGGLDTRGNLWYS